MNMQTKRNWIRLAQNYTVATVSRATGHQSSVAVTYVDKSSRVRFYCRFNPTFSCDDVFQAYTMSNGDTVPFNKYSRALGVGFELLSKTTNGTAVLTAPSQNPLSQGIINRQAFSDDSMIAIATLTQAGIFWARISPWIGYVPSKYVSHCGLRSPVLIFPNRTSFKKFGLAIMQAAIKF